MNIVIDIDLTLCKAEVFNGVGDYKNAKPISKVIEKINKLHDEGFFIILYTARGMKTFKNNIKKLESFHRPILEEWLKKHNVKYNELIFGKLWKPDYFFIDDRNLTLNQFIQNEPSDFEKIIEENINLSYE